MPKIYLLYYRFKSTAGNHAGMAYLAEFLGKEKENIILLKHVNQDYRGGRYVGFIYSLFLALYLALKLKKNDKIFFMEYLTAHVAHQDCIALILRQLGFRQDFLGLVHLSGSHLKELYKDEKTILEKARLLDEIVVFGSSLKLFFEELGFNKRILKTFHYVDNRYYKPLSNHPLSKDSLNVIFIGSLKRNFTQLHEIIKKSNSNYIFHVCGAKSLSCKELDKFPNVILYDYLSENDLLKLMQNCEVSLSVLEDTVGSNVITSSLAVGLVQVVSDVGSIRDYCTVDNSYFCSSTEDYLDALKILSSDKKKLNVMRNNALLTSSKLSLDCFLHEFNIMVD